MVYISVILLSRLNYSVKRYVRLLYCYQARCPYSPGGGYLRCLPYLPGIRDGGVTRKERAVSPGDAL